MVVTTPDNAEEADITTSGWVSVAEEADVMADVHEREGSQYAPLLNH